MAMAGAGIALWMAAAAAITDAAAMKPNMGVGLTAAADMKVAAAGTKGIRVEDTQGIPVVADMPVGIPVVADTLVDTPAVVDMPAAVDTRAVVDMLAVVDTQAAAVGIPHTNNQ
ncbi:MAG: hypothetical protein ACLQLH_15290 [Terracidiphilus sp.]